MLPEKLQRLTRLLARLPGVGERTALRYALSIAGEGSDLAERLGTALLEVHECIRSCERCGNIAELDENGVAECWICRDPRRDQHVMCVVGRVQDVLAIERSHAMRGRYFVLGKLLSPLDGIGPEELPLARMHRRIEEDGVAEIIVATPPSVDGEATALLLARELGRAGLTVTRIASGVPHGGDLEYTDQVTLSRAFDGRRPLG